MITIIIIVVTIFVIIIIIWRVQPMESLVKL